MDGTDGCAKQYRCATAMYLLSLLASKYKVVIDRAIGAPGHGKSKIDGLNAVDKRFLRSCMCMIGMPEANDGEKRMAAHAVVEDSSLSFAEECARLCSASDRSAGVKGGAKHAKHDEKAKMKKRFYHVQDPNKVKHTDLKKVAIGFHSGKKNGLMMHYNLRFDPDLGTGWAAVRRIPCACDACIEQLKLPWNRQLNLKQQPHYAPGNQQCKYWPIFEGLNDWIIIKLVDKLECTNMNEEEEVHTETLNCLTTAMAEKVQEEFYGAMMTSDTSTKDGYYVVQWTSTPYSLQQDMQLSMYNPPIYLKAGELVCNARFLNEVPRAKQWYTPSVAENEMNTVVRMQHVVMANMTLNAISETNVLPRTCNRSKAEELGALRVSDEDHETILDEIFRRENMDFNEGSYFSEDESESKRESDSTDNETDSDNDEEED